MNIESSHNIHEEWNNVYYDRRDKSLDFYNDTDTLYVHGVKPESVIQLFRNATCAGCNCPKLQDMDLSGHAIDMLREIGEALNAWNNREVEKVIAEQAAASEHDPADGLHQVA